MSNLQGWLDGYFDAFEENGPTLMETVHLVEGTRLGHQLYATDAQAIADIEAGLAPA